MLPHFLERKQGVLVLVSAAERVGLVGAASYCLAKGGMLSLTKKLATDYRSQGIRVNAVLPGNMSKEVEPLEPPPARNRPRLSDRIPTSSWEVARAIRYLLSEEAAWITGALLTVDGGFSIHAGEEPSA